MASYTEAHFVEAGAQIFYVCVVHPKAHPFRSHYVLAGPFLTEEAARAAAPEAFEATTKWQMESGGTIGIVTISQARHRGRVALIHNGAYVVPTHCEACLIAEPDSNAHSVGCSTYEADAAHGWA